MSSQHQQNEHKICENDDFVTYVTPSSNINATAEGTDDIAQHIPQTTVTTTTTATIPSSILPINNEKISFNTITSTGTTTGNNNTSTTPGTNRQLSVSESITLTCQQKGIGWNAPYYIQFIEIPFRIKDNVNNIILSETTGYCMDAFARGPFNQLGGFVGTAVLRLASYDANCSSVQNCTNTIRGLKPSSYLTVSSTTTSIIGALIMPIIGSIIDHTKYRKHIGVITAVLIVSLAGFVMLLSQQRNNWLFILILDSIQSFCLNIHSTSTLAYLPDLTNNEIVLTHYVSQIAIRQFSNNLIFIILLLISAYTYSTSTTSTNNPTAIDIAVFNARVAAGMAFGYGFIFYTYSWSFLLRQRPVLSKVPDGTTLVNAGFIQLVQTFTKIYKNYNALKWFLLSLLWTPELGSGIILSIAISFLTIQLNYTAINLSIGTISYMIGTLIGVSTYRYFLSKIMNPLNSYRLGLLVLSISISIACIVLVDETTQIISYIFIMIWGISSGWYYPCQRILYCQLIPKGQETEMMGILTFANQILQWLPPLIVTIMNENSIEYRYGLLPTSGFILLAVLFTVPMGSYIEAIELVARDSSEKLQQVLLATTTISTPLATTTTTTTTPTTAIDASTAVPGGGGDNVVGSSKT